MVVRGPWMGLQLELSSRNKVRTAPINNPTTIRPNGYMPPLYVLPLYLHLDVFMYHVYYSYHIN
jgi:hypothetical protein